MPCKKTLKMYVCDDWYLKSCVLKDKKKTKICNNNHSKKI